MANAAAAAIFGLPGLPPEGFVELGAREGYRVDGSRYGMDDWPIARSLRSGEAVKGERAEIVRADGRRMWIEIDSGPVLDGDGHVIAAVSVFHDVTARERREAAEREFISNAAHELRTPLAAIAGAIEVLQAGAKDDPEARETFLGHIERETDRLQRLVRALLTLARAQTGAEQPRLEIVELLPLFEEIGGGFAGTRVGVDIDCPPGLAALANRDLLEQIVGNLAANAAQHVAGGRFCLRAQADGAETVEIAVSDSGPGIAPAARERMFDRFFRGGARDGAGFGLGLAIVSEAVRALGGTIDVESKEGRGTTVRVRLRGAAVVAG
jgi:signal transduction histidine kinase